MPEDQEDESQQETPSTPDPNVYQPDQEEDDELEIDRRIRRANERLKRMTMVAFPQINDEFLCQDSLTVEGGFSTGWAINYIDCGKQAARVGVPTGACCIGESCIILTAAECSIAGGGYKGDGTDCDPNPCGVGPATGACCHYGVCTIETHDTCLAIPGGFYFGDGTSCFGRDCETELIGCCVCQPGQGDCLGPFPCCSTTTNTGCPEDCTFFGGFGGIGPAFCCGDDSDGTPCSVCFSWPPALATFCCPNYPPAGIRYCCHYDPINPWICCGQGDDACCNPFTQQCCYNVDPESGDLFNYCCDLATEECCGFSGCCPIGFCIDGNCTA